MTAGFFAPLPPTRTGVADYAAALLAELRKHGRVEVAPAHCDVPLYHLGNNHLHGAIYRRAMAEPGVVVLHDAVLHHFFLGHLTGPQYIEEFTYNYGSWAGGLAAELWQRRSASGADNTYFQYPMLRRIAERARAVVVHNPAAARLVREHAPAARIIEIPMLIHEPAWPADAEVLRYRSRIGLPPTAFVFGLFGFLRESKRVLTVIETFARLHRERPDTALLIAGDFASPDLARAAGPQLAAPGIVRLPYLPDREFWLAARAVDACINLRYPTAGESSAITVQFMAAGKPVFVTDAEECARFPQDACLRVASGIAEPDSLWRHMILLTSFTGVASTIGYRGAEHIRAHHRVELVAQEYWKTLCAHRC